MMDIAILQKSALAVAMKAGNDESFLPKVNAQFVKPDLLSVAKFFLFHICNLGIYKWSKCKKWGPKAEKGVFGYNCDKKALMKPI